MKNFSKTLGPGILFASTAIGVSHLIQSTRAGADYGLGLIWAVIIANFLKYPFFEYASRYANVTHTSIIDGYLKIGKWMLRLYFFITLSTMFFVTSAVAVVTTGFMDNLLGISSFLTTNGIPHAHFITPITTTIICGSILFLGKFSVLDSMMKIIGAVLLCSTLLAFVLVLIKGPINPQINLFPTKVWDWGNTATFGFIIALMGWMPTALDLSAWNSLWTLERIKQTQYQPSLKETQTDFIIGYGLSAILAICFITLGAFLFYGSSVELEDKPVGFANQVVQLFTYAMGDWSYFLIAVSAFTIMFGTFIAVMDGYSRSLERTWTLLRSNKVSKRKTSQKKAFNIALILLLSISFLIQYLFVYASFSPKKGFQVLVDFATSVSFLFAPIIAWVNFRLVHKKHIGSANSPGKFMQIVSYIGIAYLITFSLLKLYQLFLK